MCASTNSHLSSYGKVEVMSLTPKTAKSTHKSNEIREKIDSSQGAIN